MIVTDKLGFIAHPNTGTRAIREALESVGGREVGGYHEVYKPALDKLCIFSTIRNPWDLMASWYFRTLPGMEMEFSDWLEMTLDGLRHYEGPGAPLYYGVKDSKVVIRFERLQQDFDYVMRLVGDDPVKLNHVGRTNRPHGYRDVYDTDKAIRLVTRVYSEQIAMGGYEF